LIGVGAAPSDLKVERHPRVRRADLHPRDVARVAHRLRAGRDLAHPVLPDLVEGVQPFAGDLAAHVRAELAVERAERVRRVGEREPDALDRRDRDDRFEDPAVERHHLQRAGAQLLKHRGVAAELVVREHRDVEPPVRVLANGVPEIFHRDAQRMVDGLIRPGLAGELRRGGG
jgi:hypothetical protein